MKNILICITLLASATVYGQQAGKPVFPTTSARMAQAKTNQTIDLGQIPEGELYTFKTVIAYQQGYSPAVGNVNYTYPTTSKSCITGYDYDENAGITSIILQPHNILNITLNTKDRYGNYAQELRVNTQMGPIVYRIKATIVDKSVLAKK